eukprot:GEZU01018680.1.p1 GENE.GEZU01018680.1~~GEZU01018680.1.p1  ORF type:complete len:303 (+),score=19.80 GEZU01018680.1:305-1213(+)
MSTARYTAYTTPPVSSNNARTLSLQSPRSHSYSLHNNNEHPTSKSATTGSTQPSGTRQFPSPNDRSPNQRPVPVANNEVLEPIDYLVVRHQIEYVEAFTGIETDNQYQICTEWGDQWLYAAEESNRSARFCLGSNRPFTIHIIHQDSTPYLTLVRPFRFLFYEIRVRNWNGQEIGRIVKKFSAKLLTRIYKVLDHNGNLLYELVGPGLKVNSFAIQDRNGDTVGRISKKLNDGASIAAANNSRSASGAHDEEALDRCAIQFPSGASATQKAVLLAAVFLIDAIYFDSFNANATTRSASLRFF